jgi:N-acyl-D-aspartate/D-glutamate deacylase
VDTVIRNGTLIDGSGAPSRRADVGIEDGRVVAVGDAGDVAGSRANGARVIDADGLVVAPGFIDVHVHYDAQVLWDPALTPSPLHGVTTVLGGNCGFTLGQAGPDHAEYLVRLLARVEGIPLEALRAGVDWSWTDTAGYLSRVDGRVGPNAGFLAGHSTIRRAVMGERCIGGTATDDDLRSMQRILADSLSAGALGFSSSNAATHNDGAGDPVPSRFSNEPELFALCEVVAQHEGTTVEYIPVKAADEMARMTAMSLAARRPVNWNILQVGSARADEVRADLSASDHARAVGALVRALTLPARSEQRLNLRTGFIFDSLPGWDQMFKMPLDQRKAAFADPEVRRRLQRAALLAGARRAELTNWGGHLIAETFDADLAPLAGRTVGEVAAERGVDPFDALLDVSVADDLRTVLMPPVIGLDDDSWRLRATVWRDPRVLLGASDAGAHMDMLATFAFSTHLLSEGVRQRRLLPLEEAVRLLTTWPARHFGLKGRGRIAEGWCADVVVFDPETVDPGRVVTREDLPGEAQRLYSEPEGIAHVLVNGQPMVEEGSLTGDLPGTLLRSGRDTETVLPPACR